MIPNMLASALGIDLDNIVPKALALAEWCEQYQVRVDELGTADEGTRDAWRDPRHDHWTNEKLLAWMSDVRRLRLQITELLAVLETISPIADQIGPILDKIEGFMDDVESVWYTALVKIAIDEERSK